MSAVLLELEAVSVARAGSLVVREVSLAAPAGQVTVLLGANGVGKTTLLEAISGALPVVSGQVRLGGVAVEGRSRLARARLGLRHVEQGRTVFAALTVDQNLAVAAPDGEVDEAFVWFPELADRRALRAGLLSGGEQQMLVLARALLGRPRALLVDELSLGLAPRIVRRLLPVLRTIADGGAAVLLVEQFAEVALRVGDRAYVMSRGQVVLEGSCEEVARHPGVLHGVYLGRGPAARSRDELEAQA